MGVYRKWLEKSIRCLCDEFEPGGLFSRNKFLEKGCAGNFQTADKHLNELVGIKVCGDRTLVKVSPDRYTLVVPDDPLESDEDREARGQFFSPLSAEDLAVAGLSLVAIFAVPFVLGYIRGHKLRRKRMNGDFRLVSGDQRLRLVRVGNAAR